MSIMNSNVYKCRCFEKILLSKLMFNVALHPLCVFFFIKFFLRLLHILRNWEIYKNIMGNDGLFSYTFFLPRISTSPRRASSNQVECEDCEKLASSKRIKVTNGEGEMEFIIHHLCKMHKTKSGLQVGKNYETNYNQQLVSHTFVLCYPIVLLWFKR